MRIAEKHTEIKAEMPYRPDLVLKEQGFDVEDGVRASAAEIESLEQLLEGKFTRHKRERALRSQKFPSF